MMRWWEQRSLRFRLAAWYAIGGTILLTAFSATVYWYVSYTMALPLDHQLQQDLSVVRQNLRVLEGERLLWQGKGFPAGEPWPAGNPWFELWDEQGHLVQRSWPFVDSRLEQLPVAPVPGRETISVFRVSPDVRLRVLSVPLGIPGPGERWMIRVMCIHEPAMSALRSLLLILAVALPVVVVLLVLGGYAITRRWLSPLDAMVREADRITASDLSRRLPLENPHDELGRLAGVFNATLARLEDSFVTLDRFVSDASHELLTPLTTLRSVGEVGLRGARDLDDYREIIESMLEEAQRLQVLVEKLLQLARAEGGSAMLECKAVRLDLLAQQCVEDAQILAEEKRQQVRLESIPADVVTDELLFRQALQNVLDNAIKYCPEGATILVAVHQSAAECSVSVTDNGPGVPAEHLSRLMDRFFRADNARGRTVGGFGLGLAITKAYLRVLGGKISYQPVSPQGSKFILSLPLLRTNPTEPRPASVAVTPT